MGLVVMAACSLGGRPGNRKAILIAIMGRANSLSGKWRYYDGMLHVLVMMHAGGNFKIYFQG
jgi:hypothetical protein